MKNILLIISIFGFVLSTNLLFKSLSKKKRVLFLPLFYFIYSLYAFQTYIIESNQISELRWFYIWPLPIYSIIAIPTYFYFISIIKNDFNWKWKHILLFIPFILSVIDVILIYSKPSYIYNAIIDIAITNPAERFNVKYGLLDLNQHYILRHLWQFISLIVLYPILFKFIRSNRSQEKHKIVQNRWLITFYALLFLMSFLASVYGIEMKYNIGIIPFLQDYAALLQVSFYIVLFIIAIVPISFPTILHGTLALNTESLIVKTTKPKSKANHPQVETKYGLNIEDIKNKLDALEKEKLFLNPNFDLNKCAQELKIPTHHLSYFLNQNLNLSFSSYKNSLRINEAKLLIAQGYLNTSTIDALAIICGFANRSSFSKVFKQVTDLSPGEYFKSVKK